VVAHINSDRELKAVICKTVQALTEMTDKLASYAKVDVNSEKPLFSATTDLITKLRSRLLPETAEWLVLLNKSAEML